MNSDTGSRKDLDAMLTKVLLSLLAACMLLMPGEMRATELITKDEAKLPPPMGAVPLNRRGIFRAPKVELVSPVKEVRSPLRLRLTFQSFGGAKIDPESAEMKFLRKDDVNLTPRVKPFVQPTGIDVPDAETPPGEFVIRVDVRDSAGRVGTKSFVLKVLPQ
jgi:hypothetical protein